MASTSRAFVPDTFCGAGLGEGSLAGILSSPEKHPVVARKVRVEGLTTRFTADAAPNLADMIIVQEEFRSI